MMCKPVVPVMSEMTLSSWMFIWRERFLHMLEVGRSIVQEIVAMPERAPAAHKSLPVGERRPPADQSYGAA